MALNKYTDADYYAGTETGNAPDGFEGLGSYQYITLPDVINNFMVTYVGGKKVLGELGQHEAEFHAQRAIAELSYDVARPICSFEYELVGTLSMPLPKDFVNLKAVYYVDDNGVKRLLRNRRESGNPKSPLQDENGNYIYTESGEILYNSATSTTEQRYVDSTSENQDAELSLYYGLGGIDTENNIGGTGYTGRHFGLQPELANNVGTFVFDEIKGLLTFDNKVSDKIIVVDYITDGLNEDPDKIKIHKFLEEAVYMYMMSMITAGRTDVNGQDKQMFNQKYALAKRRGKHRLSNIHASELLFTLRNRTKWIKI